MLLTWAVDHICKLRHLSEIQLVVRYNVKNAQTTSDWVDIASLVPGRTESQCRYRWALDQTKQSSKSPWGEREDGLLKEIMRINHDLSWTAIAEKFNAKTSASKRTGKQCRERWRNHLDPKINKDPWNDSEDIILLKAHLKDKNKWREIAKRLKGRSENAVKNRFNILYKKYRDVGDAQKVDDVAQALEAVTKEKNEDNEWVYRTISEKEKLINSDTKIEKEYSKEEDVVSVPKEETKKTPRPQPILKPRPVCLSELQTSPVKQCTSTQEFLRTTERFINLDTQQELFVGEQGTFLFAPDRTLVRYTDFSQIFRRSDPYNTPFVVIFQCDTIIVNPYVQITASFQNTRDGARRFGSRVASSISPTYTVVSTTFTNQQLQY
eukprot:TRINITY_DN136044_c1_g1_i1.p1 TRINITY_DN136044_c1_g1~~TRINITY_DN136044_c1_g1_i1.p1  ORF type:complete len:380 (-),score=22.89 TRINITY_DN136044_c1_g1_i1:272-1411(-)